MFTVVRSSERESAPACGGASSSASAWGARPPRRSARSSGTSCSARPPRSRCGGVAATAGCARPTGSASGCPRASARASWRAAARRCPARPTGGTSPRTGWRRSPPPGAATCSSRTPRRSTAAHPRSASDAGGKVSDAYRILSGTTLNCSGGGTPWGTWLSCEEVEDGRVWECDPSGAPAGGSSPGDGHLQARGRGGGSRRQAGLPHRGPRRRRPLQVHAGALAEPRRAGCSRSRGCAAGGRVEWVKVPDAERGARADAPSGQGQYPVQARRGPVARRRDPLRVDHRRPPRARLRHPARAHPGGLRRARLERARRCCAWTR